MATKKTKVPTTAGETPDHQGASITTTDHDAIRAWAEQRGGRPATVEGTERGDDDVGLLRLEFPDAPHADDAKLDEADWDTFFGKFDANGLALVYQETTAEGAVSNFNKLVKRETAEAAKTTAAKKTTAKKSANRSTAKKASTAKKVPAAKKAPATKKPAAKKASPVAQKTATKTAAKKTAAKKTAAKKPPVAKKVAGKKTPAKKVKPVRGYRGR